MSLWKVLLKTWVILSVGSYLVASTVTINEDALFFALEEATTGRELLEVIDSFVEEASEA